MSEIKDANSRALENIDNYRNLTPEGVIRWHLLYDCACNIPSCYYEHPIEHLDNCPMHDPDNPIYDVYL